MRYKQKKIIKSLVVFFLLLFVAVASYPLLEQFVNEKIGSSIPDKETYIVYVDSNQVEESERILFAYTGAEHIVTVKHSKTHKVFDKKLIWSFAITDVIDVYDINGDGNNVNVALTSLGVTPNDFYMQIQSEDGAFVFVLTIRTVMIPVEDITAPDIIFYS